jgi:hypothetical protein
MSSSRPIQWYHSHADPSWPDGTFKHVHAALLIVRLYWSTCICVQLTSSLQESGSVSSGPSPTGKKILNQSTGNEDNKSRLCI